MHLHPDMARPVVSLRASLIEIAGSVNRLSAIVHEGDHQRARCPFNRVVPVLKNLLNRLWKVGWISLLREFPNSARQPATNTRRTAKNVTRWPMLLTTSFAWRFISFFLL